MSTIMTEDLLDQFRKAIAMVRFTIEEFDDDEWRSGISWFLTPARLAFHTVESLDAYFWPEDHGSFKYGRRFAGPWWELADDQLPGQADVLDYLADVERRIEGVFASLVDEDLATAFELLDYSANTLVGHYAYALRHTMHHQGALTALSTQHGHEAECWR